MEMISDTGDVDLACPLDASRAAAAVVDQHGTVIGWNEKAQELLGYRAEEVLGCPTARLLSGDNEVWPAPSATHKVMTGTTVLRHRDGHQVSVWVQARQVRQAGGETWRLVGADRATLRRWQMKQEILKGLFS